MEDNKILHSQELRESGGKNWTIEEVVLITIQRLEKTSMVRAQDTGY